MRDIDLLAIGSPIVDNIIHIDEDFIHAITGKKGGMELIDYTVLSELLCQTGQGIVMPGGSAANVARCFASLGGSCRFVGKIGDDIAGSYFRRQMKIAKVIPQLMIDKNTHTAQVVSLVTPDGERTMRTYLGAAATINPEELQAESFRDVNIVHTEGYTLTNSNLTETIFKLANKAKCKISLDLSSFEIVNDFQQRLEKILPSVEILFANEDELQTYGLGSIEKGFKQLALMCPIVVGMLGENGCAIHSEGKLQYFHTSPVKAIESTGAGDFFASGFLYGFCHRKPIETCAKYAMQLGAAVVKSEGAAIQKIKI